MADAGSEDKKLTRAEKKALKKAQKEEKKKKRKGKGEDVDGVEALDDEESEGGVGLIIFAIVFIVIIWLAIIALLIRMDVAGIGTMVYPYLQKVPVVNTYILPQDVEIPEESAYSFETIDEAIARIQELEKEVAALNDDGGQEQSRVSELEALVAQLQPYKDDYDAYEAAKQKFYEEVVFSDKAPDINEYRTYYESIEPDNAEKIYKSVVEQQQVSEKIQDYANAYSSMKPAQAATIFDTMTNNFPLVGKILWTMDADARGKILAQMAPENAAALTNMMEP